MGIKNQTFLQDFYGILKREFKDLPLLESIFLNSMLICSPCKMVCKEWMTNPLGFRFIVSLLTLPPEDWVEFSTLR